MLAVRVSYQQNVPVMIESIVQGHAQPQAFIIDTPLLPSGNLPFVLLPAEASRADARLKAMVEEGHTPQAWAYSPLSKCFSQPSALKMHDWMLLAGPIGKYALQETMGPEQRKVVFDYLDLLSAVWSRRISVRDAEALRDQAYWVMARLEVYLPAWELDITRHMVLHMIEQILEKGPVWCWSMWSYERLWNLNAVEKPASSS